MRQIIRWLNIDRLLIAFEKLIMEIKCENKYENFGYDEIFDQLNSIESHN